MGVRVAVLSAMVLFALLVKTIVAPTFAVAGFRPDVLVLVIVAVSLLEGPDIGLRLGFLAGLSQDLVSGAGSLVGLWAVVLMLVGYLSGLAKPYLVAVQQAGAIILAGTMAALATLGYGLLGKVFAVVVVPWGQVLSATIVVALYSAAISPLVIRPAQAIMRQFPPASAGG